MKEEIYSAVMESSNKYDRPPAMVLSVIQQESGFKKEATSHCGAAGMMQLMPETAQELGVKDRYDVRQNIDGGCKYLREMLNRFDGDVDKALAAYNAGPGNVEKYGGIPPFEETQNYVASIKSHMGELGAAGDSRLAAFSILDQIDLAVLPELFKTKNRAVEKSAETVDFSQLRRRV